MKRPPPLQSNEENGERDAARRGKYFLWKDGIIPYVFGSTLSKFLDMFIYVYSFISFRL